MVSLGNNVWVTNRHSHDLSEYHLQSKNMIGYNNWILINFNVVESLPLPTLGILIPISVTGSDCIAGIISTSSSSSGTGHLLADRVVFQSVAGNTWIPNLFSCVYKIEHKLNYHNKTFML